MASAESALLGIVANGHPIARMVMPLLPPFASFASQASRVESPLKGAHSHGVAFACYNVCSYLDRMVLELKLRKVGNLVGVVLPKEALARLNVQEGDTLTLTDAPAGGLRELAQ